MKGLTVYIAGPDVFKSDAGQIYANYQRLCNEHGCTCLYPNDSTIEPADTPEGFASNIYQANLKMIGRADVVIINVDPYHGPSMDVGAAFEMGCAKASGKPVFAFSSETMQPYFDRLKNYHGEIVECDMGFRGKQDGLLLENFGLSDNLMVAHAAEKVVYPSFECALLAAINSFDKMGSGTTDHHTPEEDFPIWLDAFDHANDQHQVTKERLNFFIDGLMQRMPAHWRTMSQLKVLDLACGDGRFSRRIIDLIERKLDLEVDYRAIELNPDLVALAQGRFPRGTVLQGNIFDQFPEFIGKEFCPDIIFLSHAIYFAKDVLTYVRRLASLGGPDTLTMYLVNDPIYRDVPKYIDTLVAALEKADLPFTASVPFRSHVNFPQTAIQCIDQFRDTVDGVDMTEDSATTRHLLSFFQQSPLSGLDAEVRNEYLDRVRRDLLSHEGKVPFQNHCIVALHRDSSHAMQEMAEWAIKYMDVVCGLKSVLEIPALSRAG